MKTIKQTLRVVAATLALGAASIALAQQAYPTPEAAADAFVDAIARHDGDALKSVVGPDYRTYIPRASVDPDDITNFLEAWAKAHKIVPAGADKAYLGAGTKGWTMPIPIVKSAAGWHFDTHAAPEEMRIRRIGRNELAAIKAMYAYFDAQREYAQQDRNGDGMLEYARRFVSSPGRHDGLYWPTADGEPPSPAGPLFDTRDIKDGYYGYRFKILEAQGPAASGGARSYLTRGHLANGFALVAWPARYGDTGVMSFVVNHDGVVYQKNLGAASASIASAMTRFDPDATWTPLPAP